MISPLRFIRGGGKNLSPFSCLADCPLLLLLTTRAPQICAAQQWKKPKSCWDSATTQLAMNACAESKSKAAETRMASFKKLGTNGDDPAGESVGSLPKSNPSTI